MRILQVAHNFVHRNKAGSEIHTYSLSKELGKQNKVYLFFNDFQVSRKEFTRKGYYEDLPFVSVNSSDPYQNYTYKNRRVDRAFERIIEQFRPDIVHFQHLINLSMSLVDVIYQEGIPTVFTLHDYWLMCPQIHLIDNDLYICTEINRFKCLRCLWSDPLYKLKPIQASQPGTYVNLPKNLIKMVLNAQLKLRAIPFILYNRPKAIQRILDRIDLFIAPSRLLREKIIQMGIVPTKIIYLEHGIDDSMFHTIQKVSSRQLRFGFVGSTIPIKGISVLIRAFNNVREAVLDIYGRVTEEQREDCEKLIQNKNIKFRGEVCGETKREAFSNIDVLIVPSICFENSPVVIHEGFAAGIPVIASNIGGIPELVKDGKTGLLFKVGNSEELFEKIMYFINNPSEVERMSKQIKPVKTIKEHAVEIENIYFNLIEKKIKRKK